MDGGITATSLGNLAGRPRAANPCVAGRLSGDVGERADLRPPRRLTASRRAIDRALPKGQIGTPYSAGYEVRSVELGRAQRRVRPEIWGRVTMMPPRESTQPRPRERHESKVREKEWSLSMLPPTRRAFLGALAVNVKTRSRDWTRARTMYIGDVRNAITSRLKRAMGRGSWNMVGVGAVGRGDLPPLFCFGADMDLSHTTEVRLCPFLAFGCKVKLSFFF